MVLYNPIVSNGHLRTILELEAFEGTIGTPYNIRSRRGDARVGGWVPPETTNRFWKGGNGLMKIRVFICYRFGSIFMGAYGYIYHPIYSFSVQIHSFNYCLSRDLPFQIVLCHRKDCKSGWGVPRSLGELEPRRSSQVELQAGGGSRRSVGSSKWKQFRRGRSDRCYFEYG